MKKFVCMVLVLTMLLCFTSVGFAEETAAASNEVAISEESEVTITDIDIEDLISAAEGGDAKAQCMLGQIYAEGSEEYSINQDIAEAVFWFSRAVKGGDVTAMRQLGIMYCYGIGVRVDAEKGLDLLESAANLGDVEAPLGLALIYDEGISIYVDKDINKALEWYEKAAELGRTEAMLKLAALYYEGNRVAHDYGKVMEWAQKAADAGSVDAMVVIGMLYEEGEGVEEDPMEAMIWYRDAAALGSTKAMVCIADMYYFGNGVKENEAKAFEWYEKAALLGDVEATLELIDTYERDYPDLNKAIVWADKLAQFGSGEGYQDIASCYVYYGEGEKAVEFYEKAASLGDKYSMYKLGELYSKGELVEKDDVKAQEWMDRYYATF